ncbi:MAG: hypothetical protein BGO68_01630 [Candidatus Amoebophilus sp. 36-38]|nr:MAG: hypothetical protein BGO68_01630 [Candidatus Amoebophilus sp. 36-38]
MGVYKLYKKLSYSRNPDVSNISLSIQIKRLENDLFNLQTKADITSFIETNQLVAAQFLGVETDEDKNKMIDQLYNMVHNTSMQALYQEVAHTFKDLTSLITQLEQAFKYLKHYYPQFEAPQIVTLITGFGSDLYVSKELIIIGLDYFLGENSKFRPHIPSYILRTYQPTYIAPKVILLLSHLFNTGDPKDHTLLHDMLYYGKAYYFTKTFLLDVPDPMILGYTADQWTDTENHQRIVWQHFIDHALFYETNHLVKKKYVGERPFTSEIGPGCPGNIGGWLGWQIVKKYMKNSPEITLPMLMQNANMQHLFEQAKYRPT